MVILMNKSKIRLPAHPESVVIPDGDVYLEKSSRGHDRSRSIYGDDYERNSAMQALIYILDNPTKFDLVPQFEGLYDILDIRDAFPELDKKFEYMTEYHIFELFHIDRRRILRFEIDSDIPYLGRVTDNIQDAPDQLYFGTVDSVIDVAMQHGIRSNTKPFVRLFDNKKSAFEFSGRFSSVPSDAVVVTVDAKRAQANGVKFSKGRNKNEWLATAVPPEFLVLKEKPKNN